VRFGPILDILRVGVPASLATLVNYLGLLLLTAVVARYGTNEIAAFGLGTRLDFVILTLAFGVGSALLTLVGLAAGAGDLARVSALLTRAVGMVASMLALLAALLFWKPSIWLGLFTADPAIVAIGDAYLRIVAPTYPFVGAAMASSFAFQGLGRAVFPLALVTVRTAIVVSAAIALARFEGPVSAVFALMAAGNVASSAILYSRLRRLLRAAAAS
jgi:Na+-driven multidrug efflux pump